MRFRLLGPVEASVGGRLVDVGPARQRCVLTTLLLDANRAVSADQLVDRVWAGNSLPERPRKAVQIYVSLLRTALAGIDDVAIVRRSDGYSIELDEQRVDVHEFRALVAQAGTVGEDERAVATLEQALGLWRGEAFGTLDTPWLAAVRASLTQERQTAERDLTDFQLRQGRHGMLLARLSGWAREQPLDERLAGQLMLALFRSGRQADALDEYQRLRGRLDEDLGADPGRVLQELYQRILTDDPSLALAAAATASVTDADAEAATQEAASAAVATASTSVPRHLPAAPRWFTGRRAELDVLLSQAGGAVEVAGDGVVAILAIDGMAGVGKTALAVHAAHRLAGTFPDGQLFIDLHGYTRGYQPRTANEALDWLLRALGVSPRQIPQDVEERAAMYRQRLAATRTLIVLDNAADESQVRPLLPGDGGCLVLVTSRRRLKGLDDAFALSLDVLPLTDALDLLRTVAGASRVAADDRVAVEVAELCGRLPLALRIAGALLRHRPAWSPEHLVSLLRDQRGRVRALSDGERDLHAVFELSYQSLSPAHQRMFRRLGLIPGPDVDAFAGAALADTDPDTASGLLENLVDHNLLLQQVPGRYRMHDLIRLHARTLVDNDAAHDRHSALERLLDYYQHTASRAEDLITRFSRIARLAGPAPMFAPVFADSEAAWSWQRVERPNLLAVVQHAATHGQAERCVALTASLSSLLRTDGPWPQAVALHTAAAEQARDIGDQASQAHALIQRGEVRGATGDYAGAARDLKDALILSREVGDDDLHGQAHALTLLGHERGLTGDYAAAVSYLDEAVGIYWRLGDRRGQSHALTQLGQVRKLSGDYMGAADDLEVALTLCRELDDLQGQAHALIEIAHVRRSVGDLVGAVRDLLDALVLCRDLDDRRGQAHGLTLLGDVQRLAGDYESGAQALREALELYQQVGDRLGQATALTLLGAVRCLDGDQVAGIADLAEALDQLRLIGARANEAWALNHYAAAIAATGDQVEAAMLYGDALRTARETHQPDDEANALEGIGECHARRDTEISDTEIAMAYFKQSLDIFQHIGMTSDADRVQARLDQLAAPDVM